MGRVARTEREQAPGGRSKVQEEDGRRRSHRTRDQAERDHRAREARTRLARAAYARSGFHDTHAAASCPAGGANTRSGPQRAHNALDGRQCAAVPARALTWSAGQRPHFSSERHEKTLPTMLLLSRRSVIPPGLGTFLAFESPISTER